MLKSLMSAYTIAKSSILKGGYLLLLGLCLISCSREMCSFEPNVSYCVSKRNVECLPSSFPPLTNDEMKTEWGKELFLGIQFAKDFDFYRAISCYKRALYLSSCHRQGEIEFHILEAYYLAGKYEDVIETYETGSLRDVPLNFPAMHELLLMLFDAYESQQDTFRAERIRRLIESENKEEAERLQLYQEIQEADFPALLEKSEEDQEVSCFLNQYCSHMKSVKKAELLNALLPGAGYFYVEQKQTGVTAFIVNFLFTFAAIQSFKRGDVALGAILTSLEVGWYVGGINGAGLAAKQWNEKTYAMFGKEFLLKEKAFPILMFEYAF